jgi:hypothetical protein
MNRSETRLVKAIEEAAAASDELFFIVLPTSRESRMDGDVHHLVGPFHSKHIAAHMASWSHATIDGGQGHLHIDTHDRESWSNLNEMPLEYNVVELKVRRLSQMKRADDRPDMPVTIALLVETWVQKVISRESSYELGKYPVVANDRDVQLATELAYELKWSIALPENYFA